MPRLISTTSELDGDGAKTRIILGSNKLQSLDPFVLFEHFSVAPPHGFRDHPHRGFINIVYILSGICQHEDFLNTKGELDEGDFQWMLVGRGIVHSEMPKNGPMAGFQLWINLKSSQKTLFPSSHKLKSNDFPVLTTEKFKAKILVGQMLNETSPIKPISPVEIFDVEIEDGGVFEYWVLENWSFLVYVISGKIDVMGIRVEEDTAVAWEVGLASLKAVGKCRVWVMAGEKIGEKIVSRGPFVMNTEDEIRQAYQDFNQNVNGFEGANKWRSSSG